MSNCGQSLLKGLRAGDSEAFAQIVDDYMDMVYSLAYGIMGHWADAEDVCQEVFLRLFDAVPILSPDTCLRSYLRRICVNYCVDELRRRSREPTMELKDTAGQLVSNSPGPLRLVADHQFRERIIDCLQ